jgi:hypothetical protein
MRPFEVADNRQRAMILFAPIKECVKNARPKLRTCLLHFLAAMRRNRHVIVTPQPARAKNVNGASNDNRISLIVPDILFRQVFRHGEPVAVFRSKDNNRKALSVYSPTGSFGGVGGSAGGVGGFAGSATGGFGGELTSGGVFGGLGAAGVELDGSGAFARAELFGDFGR